MHDPFTWKASEKVNNGLEKAYPKAKLTIEGNHEADIREHSLRYKIDDGQLMKLDVLDLSGCSIGTSLITYQNAPIFLEDTILFAWRKNSETKILGM